jgi:hypothetical protein
MAAKIKNDMTQWHSNYQVVLTGILFNFDEKSFEHTLLQQGILT